MDPIRNPYAPGAGTPPPELAGRDSLVQDAAIALARLKQGRPERGLLLTGLRGVGKTVLLNKIRGLAEEQGYLVDLMEAPEDRPLARILIPSLRQTLLRLSSAEKAKRVVHHAMAVLKSLSLSVRAGDIEFAIKADPASGHADSGDLERDLAETFVAVGRAAKEGGVAMALLIDELQYLNRMDLAALIVAVHRVNQEGLPVFLSGAGLPSLPALSGDAKSYAERLFKYPRIGALAREDAREALADPAADLGVSFTDDALEEIVRVTQGYPYFLQEWGYVVWNLADASPISVAAVKQAHAEATARLDESFFRVRLDRVTDAERRYMHAMAELGPGAQRSGDVAQRLNRKSTSFGPVRDALIRKGMIFSPKHGFVEFTVPLFDEFLRRAGLEA